jgi:hypothetical protein
LAILFFVPAGDESEKPNRRGQYSMWTTSRVAARMALICERQQQKAASDLAVADSLVLLG